ncbi:hypothetical protein [Streptomyces sp. NPDC001389]|uniref:hypothetical protein n=1 Tax=Streptomyces sp. NPDC001389 TaxID=3364569 RepID=UPI003691B151
MSHIIAGDPAPTNPQAEAAVRSLVNGGYAERIAREIIASVRGEARVADAMAEGTRRAVAWNASCPIGTPVMAYPGTRDEEGLSTRTRSLAWNLGHGEPVVQVEGYAGGISLDHVDVITGSAMSAHDVAAKVEAQPGIPRSHDRKIGFVRAQRDGNRLMVEAFREVDGEWAPSWVATARTAKELADEFFESLMSLDGESRG